MNVVEVQNLLKTFKIPNESRDSVRENIFNLFKRNGYEEFHAVNDLSFEIQEGEFFGIIGQNGSGKSTLLKMLAGVYFPSSGDIKTKGKIVPFLELGVGFNPELTGRENVFLNATILGLSEDEVMERYDDIVEFSELGRFMDQKLKNYSSGMQVRLAFSVAMQVDGDIFLMDEVLAVGDTAFQNKCFNKFRELRSEGKTIVFVTHDLASVRSFCDRVLYIKRGKQMGVGKVNEMVDKYIYDYQGPISSDEDIDEAKRKGNKKIEIKSVKIVDKFGEESENFVSGDKMEIKVKYAKTEGLIAPVFGIKFYDDRDNYCFATNTGIRKIDTSGLSNEGEISLLIEKLPFLSGKYSLTLAFVSEDFTEIYDWIEKASFFDVQNKTNNEGVFNIDLEIKL